METNGPSRVEFHDFYVSSAKRKFVDLGVGAPD